MVFSCDKAALWLVQSVISSLHFQLLLLIVVTSMQRVKVKGQRSRSQRSKLNLAVPEPCLLLGFIDGYNTACCNIEVFYCFLFFLFFYRSSVKFRGHTGPKIADFDSNLKFQDCNSSLNWPMATQGLMGQNITIFYVVKPYALKSAFRLPHPGDL